MDYRRIVELVTATWVRAEGSAGEPPSVGNWRRPSRSPCHPLAAGQPCPEQPCQQTWNGPGRDQPGLFSMAWPTVHREVFRHLVRERFGAAAAAQVSWSAPRPICVAGGFPRYGIHAPVPSVQIRGVRTFPLRAIGRVARPMRHTVTAPTRQLARRGRLGCTEAHHRDLGSRVLRNWTALTPEPGPALPCCEHPSLASPRTPVRAASSLSGPGNGSDSRLTADPLLAAHSCDQLCFFH